MIDNFDKMKTFAFLELEAVADDVDCQLRLACAKIDSMQSGLGRTVFGSKGCRKAWVAKITGVDPKFGFKREFMPYKKDYSRSNGTGSRGVYRVYFLPTGNIYEVSEPRGWSAPTRWFCRVVDGKIVKIDREEVVAWAKSV